MSSSNDESENSWTETSSSSEGDDSTESCKLYNSPSLRILAGLQSVIKMCTPTESACSHEIRSVPCPRNKNEITVMSSIPPAYKLSNQCSPAACTCASKTHSKNMPRFYSKSVQTNSEAWRKFSEESLLVPIQSGTLSPLSSNTTIATDEMTPSCSTLTESTQTTVSRAIKELRNVKLIDNKGNRYSLCQGGGNERLASSLPATVSTMSTNNTKVVHISLRNDDSNSCPAYIQQEDALKETCRQCCENTSAKPNSKVEKMSRKFNLCKSSCLKSKKMNKFTQDCGTQTVTDTQVETKTVRNEYPLMSSNADVQRKRRHRRHRSTQKCCRSSTIVIPTQTKSNHFLLEIVHSRSNCNCAYHSPVANTDTVDKSKISLKSDKETSPTFHKSETSLKSDKETSPTFDKSETSLKFDQGTSPTLDKNENSLKSDKGTTPTFDKGEMSPKMDDERLSKFDKSEISIKSDKETSPKFDMKESLKEKSSKYDKGTSPGRETAILQNSIPVEPSTAAKLNATTSKEKGNIVTPEKTVALKHVLKSALELLEDDKYPTKGVQPVNESQAKVLREGGTSPLSIHEHYHVIHANLSPLRVVSGHPEYESTGTSQLPPSPLPLSSHNEEHTFVGLHKSSNTFNKKVARNDIRPPLHLRRVSSPNPPVQQKSTTGTMCARPSIRKSAGFDSSEIKSFFLKNQLASSSENVDLSKPATHTLETDTTDLPIIEETTSYLENVYFGPKVRIVPNQEVKKNPFQYPNVRYLNPLKDLKSSPPRRMTKDAAIEATTKLPLRVVQNSGESVSQEEIPVKDHLPFEETVVDVKKQPKVDTNLSTKFTSPNQTISPERTNSACASIQKKIRNLRVQRTKAQSRIVPLQKIHSEESKSNYRFNCSGGNTRLVLEKLPADPTCTCKGTSADDDCECNKPKKIRYATAKISTFKNYSTFEIFKSSKLKPKQISSIVDNVFVMRNKTLPDVNN